MTLPAVATVAIERKKPVQGKSDGARVGTRGVRGGDLDDLGYD